MMGVFQELRGETGPAQTTFDTSKHPRGCWVRGTYDEVSVLHGLVLIKHFPAC